MARTPEARKPAVPLRTRMEREIASLEAERARIAIDAEKALAAVDAKIAALTGAAVAVTTEVEAAYTALLGLGLIQEIE